MDYMVKTSCGDLPVAVTEKAIKNIRLRVFPSREIRLSVPRRTTPEYIVRFLEKKTNWINRQIERFKETEANEKEDQIRTGTSTRVLGRQLVIKILQAKQKRIIRDDLTLFIFTPTPEDQQDVDRQFTNWWQKNSKIYFLEQLKSLFPIMKRHGLEMPALVVRKMQTLWGSCSRKHHTINLNYYLYKAPVSCVEYVILHELTHFLYPHHDRRFLDFLTIYMPDWKERKHLLDYEIVRGV